MRILVTGGAGFIGSHVAEGYLNDGHKVAVLDNLSTGKKENVPKEAKFFEGDIRDKNRIFEVFREFRPEILNHHAAQIDVRKSVENPLFDAETNILGLLNLLEACVSFEVRKIIYISSGGAIYGNPKYLPIDEEHPKQPLSPYGIGKYTGELYLYFYSQVRDLKYVVLRYSNVYGPRQDPAGEAGVVAIFSNLMLKGERPKIFGDGRQTRDYIFVEDVVLANKLALKHFENQAFNIATGKATSVNELFLILKKICSFSRQPEYLPERPGELRESVLDIQKAKKLLLWQPRFSLEEGLRKTVLWLKSRKS
jgi:UDP-glucose 4-epimerase